MRDAAYRNSPFCLSEKFRQQFGALVATSLLSGGFFAAGVVVSGPLGPRKEEDLH